MNVVAANDSARADDLSAMPPVRGVLHLVGRLTDTVFSFLGPATTALAEQGVSQTVVLVDDPRFRHLLVRFEPSVQLVLINDTRSFRTRNARLLEAYCQTARRMQPTAAHLHGAVCLMLGLYASRVQKLAVPTFFTPHGSRTLAPLLSLWAVLMWLLRPLSTRLSEGIIASSGSEARQMKEMMTVHLVESPVSMAFFQDLHDVEGAPRVITGHRAPHPLGAASFSQCAVLLAGQMSDLRFSWIGAVDAESSARLSAAGVKVVDINDDEMRARHMASAWVFLAPEELPGFPVYLAEAMALGLPCVVWDTPSHRDLIRDGDTGFLVRDTDEALDRLAELLESSELRRRLGEAARAEALARFDNRKFRTALLGVYGMQTLS